MYTDALHVAGQMTGKSYKDDSETESLGIGLLIAANRNREQVLRKSGDTYMVNGQSTVVCGNVQTANATVYIIDTVLMPPSA